MLKHTPKINADILKDINTTVVQVLSENKLPYPAEHMISPSKCRDDVIMTSYSIIWKNLDGKLIKLFSKVVCRLKIMFNTYL